MVWAWYTGNKETAHRATRFAMIILVICVLTEWAGHCNDKKPVKPDKRQVCGQLIVELTDDKPVQPEAFIKFLKENEDSCCLAMASRICDDFILRPDSVNFLSLRNLTLISDGYLSESLVLDYIRIQDLRLPELIRYTCPEYKTAGQLSPVPQFLTWAWSEKLSGSQDKTGDLEKLKVEIFQKLQVQRNGNKEISSCVDSLVTYINPGYLK